MCQFTCMYCNQTFTEPTFDPDEGDTCKSLHEELCAHYQGWPTLREAVEKGGGADADWGAEQDHRDQDGKTRSKHEE